METLLTTAARVGWAHLWQVTLLFAAVAAIVKLFAANRPHLACALWLVVLVKCVTPPLWSSSAGVFCLLQPRETIARHSPPITDVNEPALRSFRDEDKVILPPLPSRGEFDAAPRDLPLPTHVQPSAEKSAGIILPIIAAIYVLGALLYAAVLTTRWLACRRRILAGKVPTEPALADLIADLQQRLHIRGKVKILVTTAQVGPAVVGLWRPTIILPAAVVRDQDPRELEPLLAHELIHIRRGDLWTALLQTAAACLWWFHPLVRSACRLFTRESERSCDEEVIASLGCDPAAYARGLLAVLTLKQQLQAVPTFPGVRPVEVTGRRLERIMHLGQGSHRRTPWWCRGVFILAAAVTLPGAAILVTGQEPKPPLQSAPQALPAKQPAAVAPADPLVLREFAADDLLAQPTVRSPHLLVELVKGSAPGPWDDSPQPNAQAKSIRYDGGKLIVRQTADGQRRIAEQLQLFREQGFPNLVIDVRMLRAPVGLHTLIPGKWETINPPAEANAPDDLFDSPPGGNVRGRADSVTTKMSAAISTTVPEAKLAEFLKRALTDRPGAMISSPTITTINGHSVDLESMTQRPFVTGVTAVDKDARQPEIRVISEGWKARLRSSVLANNRARLEIALAQRGIRNVEVAELPLGAVQIPEVVTSRLDISSEMELGHTFVVGGLQTPVAGGKTEPMWVLVNVRKAEREPEPQPPKAASRVAAALALDAAPKKGDSDQTKLQGRWQIDSIAMQETVFRREEAPEGWKDTFSEVVKIEGDRLNHSETAKGKWKLDETRSPKQITFQDVDGKLTFRGIYKLEDDTLTICVNGDGTDVRRPEEFVTKTGTPLIVITLKRAVTK